MDRWIRPTDEHLLTFMESSVLCNTDHSLVKATANMLVADAPSAREAAINIFRYVRENIIHSWVPLGQRASTTIRRGKGDCWPKAILQVALLRSVGIPARYHWFEYKKQLFLGLVPDMVYAKLDDPFPFHVAAELSLDDRWVLADATFDHYLAPRRALDWDGVHDVLTLFSDEITRDLGVARDFEEKIPEIRRYFGMPDWIETEDIDRSEPDAEATAVNLFFDIIRVKNRLDEFIGATIK